VRVTLNEAHLYTEVRKLSRCQALPVAHRISNWTLCETCAPAARRYTLDDEALMKIALLLLPFPVLIVATTVLILAFEAEPNIFYNGPFPTRLNLLVLHYIMTIVRLSPPWVFDWRGEHFQMSVWAKANYRIEACRFALKTRRERKRKLSRPS
jgi:hypothetical protein